MTSSGYIQPLVSIITPTFNRLPYLLRAIESVRAQSYPHWEHIIVDDGSADGTKDKIRQLAGWDSRIKFLQENHHGAASARNAGLKIAGGAYIAFLDDDDTWHPRKLEKQIAFMESNPSVALSHTEVGWHSGRELLKPSSERPRLVENFYDLLYWPCPLATSSVMIRKNCLDEVGGFRTQYSICEDHDLWLRIAIRWEIRALHEPLAFYGDKDMRAQLTADNIRNQEWAIRLYRDLEHEDEFRDHQKLIHRHRARIHYEMGRELIEAHRFRKAAKAFSAALWLDPLVGLTTKRKGEQGLSLCLRLVKSYASVPVCWFKSLKALGHER